MGARIPSNLCTTVSAQASQGWRGQRPLVQTSAGDEEAGPPGRGCTLPFPCVCRPPVSVRPGNPALAHRETGAGGRPGSGCTNLGLPIWILLRVRTGRRWACAGAEGKGDGAAFLAEEALEFRAESLGAGPSPASSLVPRAVHSPHPQCPLPPVGLYPPVSHTVPPCLPFQNEHVPRCQALVHEKALPGKCLILTKAQGGGSGSELRMNRGALGTRLAPGTHTTTRPSPRFFSSDCPVLATSRSSQDTRSP